MAAKKRKSRRSRSSRRYGNASYRDLETKSVMHHGYLIETAGRSYAQPGFARSSKYGYTTHGPAGRRGSGLIFFSRAEALAAGKAQVASEER